jgi:hypothetical protein
MLLHPQQVSAGKSRLDLPAEKDTPSRQVFASDQAK